MSPVSASKEWKVYPPQSETQNRLAEDLEVSPLLARILINRGFYSAQGARQFLTPTVEHIQSPHGIPHLDEAATLIYDTLRKKQRICVYGDYDVDGITGTTLLVSALRDLGSDPQYYIPHRYDEGYGLNKAAIQRMVDQGIDLIVTVDCGISNLEEVEYANSQGLTVIITDHHNPPEQLPPARAIVDPKLGQEGSFFYNLAGVGVAFKVAEKLFELDGRRSYIYENPYLDLVALGTVTDIVPLLNVNRSLTALGLRTLNDGCRLGVKLLHSISNSKSAINTQAIGFIIGPRLNAAGRMDDASVAVNLLLTKDEEEALRLAANLNELNARRRQTGEMIKEDALQLIESTKGVAQRRVLILTERDWHPGIIGIVASQIAKSYSKPTALIAVNEGMGRGSVRSVGGVDIFTPLVSCSHLLIDFGGHKEAAGFKVKEENIPEFMSCYEESLSLMVGSEALTPTIYIDAVLDPQDISFEMAEGLACLAPHGQGNPQPVFATYNLFPVDYRLVGNGAHLKITFSDKNRLYQAIGFNMSHFLSKIKSGSVNIAYTLEINEWKGRKTLQLNLQDIQAVD